MEDLLTTSQVAQRLGLSPGTLTNWRSLKIGPHFKKLGKVVRYRLSDVLRWVEGKR